MATMILYGKTPLKIFNRTKFAMVLKLDMKNQNLKVYNACINDDPVKTLTSFTTRSHFGACGFEWGKLLESNSMKQKQPCSKFPN